jgi:hypothetical protein
VNVPELYVVAAQDLKSPVLVFEENPSSHGEESGVFGQ